MWHSGATGIRHAVKTGWAHASPAPLHYLNPGLNLNMPHVLMSSAYGPLLFPAIKKRNVSEGWKRGGVEDREARASVWGCVSSLPFLHWSSQLNPLCSSSRGKPRVRELTWRSRGRGASLCPPASPHYSSCWPTVVISTWLRKTAHALWASWV